MVRGNALVSYDSIDQQTNPTAKSASRREIRDPRNPRLVVETVIRAIRVSCEIGHSRNPRLVVRSAIREIRVSLLRR